MPLSSDDIRAILEEQTAQVPEMTPLVVAEARRIIGERVITDVFPDIDADTREVLCCINRMAATAGVFIRGFEANLILSDLAPNALQMFVDFGHICGWLTGHWDTIPDEDTKRTLFTRSDMTELRDITNEHLREYHETLDATGAIIVNTRRITMLNDTAGSLIALAVGDTRALIFLAAMNGALRHLRVHAGVLRQAEDLAQRDDMKES